MIVITIDWGDVNETILVMTIKGAWTSPAFIQAAQKINMLVSSKDYHVDLLVDANEAANIPIDSFKILPTIIRKRPENAAKTIIITKNQVWRNMWKLLQPANRYLGQHDFIFVTDANEAYNLLKSADTNKDNPTTL